MHGAAAGLPQRPSASSADFPGGAEPSCWSKLSARKQRPSSMLAMAVIEPQPAPQKRSNSSPSAARGEENRSSNDSRRTTYGELVFLCRHQLPNWFPPSRQFEPGDWCRGCTRTKRHVALAEEAFLAARLPYRLVGAQRFLWAGRKSRDMIAFLRLVYNPADEVLRSTASSTSRHAVIGDKTILTLHRHCQGSRIRPRALSCSIWRAAPDSPYFSSFSGRAALPLADFGAALQPARTGFPTYTVAELFDRMAVDIQLHRPRQRRHRRSKERWENVLETAPPGRTIIPRARWPSP